MAEQERQILRWLETSSQRMIEAINGRVWSSPIWKLAADYVVGDSFDDPVAMSAADALSECQKIAEENPQWHMDVEGLSSHFDGPCHRERALVRLTVKVRGRPLGVTRNGLALMVWEKQSPGWRLTGFDDYLGFMI